MGARVYWCPCFFSNLQFFSFERTLLPVGLHGRHVNGRPSEIRTRTALVLSAVTPANLAYRRVVLSGGLEPPASAPPFFPPPQAGEGRVGAALCRMSQESCNYET